MNNLVQDLINVGTNVEVHWEQIGATLLSGYSFVVAHGGLATMWYKFMGTTPKNTPPTTATTVITALPSQPVTNQTKNG